MVKRIGTLSTLFSVGVGAVLGLVAANVEFTRTTRERLTATEHGVQHLETDGNRSGVLFAVNGQGNAAGHG